MIEKLRANGRIVGAITAKDLWEGLRNKNAVGVILSALFVVVMYRFLPALTRADDPLRVLLHDAGDSTVVAVLENSPAIRVYHLPSAEDVEHALAEDGDVNKFGLVIPAVYDEVVASGGEPTLTGYVMGWMSESEVRDTEQVVEGEIAAMTGVSVAIEEHRVELLPDGVGGGLMPATGMAFVSLMIGMMVPTHLMLEEKQQKTLSALLVSPATVGQVVLGKALTGLAYALLGVGVAVAVNQRLVNHWGLMAIVAIPGALFSVALGLLLGSLLDSRQQLMLWAWVLLVPLTIPMFLSIMTDIIPDTLVMVFRAIPTVALFELFRMSFAGAVTAGDWGPRLLVLLGWTAAGLGAVVWILRRSGR
jgi:ABC-2 type transport system permease protein